MKSKEISHEIIDVPVDTNVKFRTSTDPGSYIPCTGIVQLNHLYAGRFSGCNNRI